MYRGNCGVDKFDVMGDGGLQIAYNGKRGGVAVVSIPELRSVRFLLHLSGT